MALVLKLLGIRVKIPWGNVVGVCPLQKPSDHEGHSFRANLDRNTFQCFRCGEKGDSLDLWARATKQSLVDAEQDLCALLTNEPPRRESEQDEGNRKMFAVAREYALSG